MTICVEQTIWEADSLAVSKEILRFLWEATGQYRFQEGRKRSERNVSSTFAIMDSLDGVSDAFELRPRGIVRKIRGVTQLM